MNIGIKNTISERIQDARKRMGISREDLITLINKDPDRPISKRDKLPITLEFETYRRWEDGTNRIKLDWIPILCKYLKCDAGYLFGEYNELTHQKANIHYETGLSESAIDVLKQLKLRSSESVLVRNIIDTINLMLIHTNEKMPEYEIIPFLETLSAYLNCAPEDDRIISVELDGSVKIYSNRNSFENEPGEAVAGEYMRQIVRTRLEQRVMDELRNLWNEKNGESRKAFINRIINQTQNRSKTDTDSKRP